MDELRRRMDGVVDYNSLRQQLTADMADSSQRQAVVVLLTQIMATRAHDLGHTGLPVYRINKSSIGSPHHGGRKSNHQTLR